MISHVLSIAGSDPSGGAGIQADLKTFSALGCYGMSVLTALTAQNTLGVHAVHPVPATFVLAQLQAILDDIRVDSTKIGMLATSDIVNQLADCLLNKPIPFVVLDTVMIAKGGHSLVQTDAIAAICQRLLPLADLITPNLPEAAALLNCQQATTEEEMCQQGYQLLALGCKAVLMKGGHLNSSHSPDWLIAHGLCQRFNTVRIDTKNTHGTGCTLSAAIAALQPQLGLVDAVQAAKEYLQGALQHADLLNVGRGIGPTHHLYRWRHNDTRLSVQS